MELIKIVLVAAFLIILFWAFRHRRRVGFRATTRLALLSLTAFATVSVIDTAIPQRVADFLGVTRGTDLVLYVLVVVFALTSAGLYFRCRDIEMNVAELARSMALRDAIIIGGSPGDSK
jgi:hypothetical protein